METTDTLTLLPEIQTSYKGRLPAGRDRTRELVENAMRASPRPDEYILRVMRAYADGAEVQFTVRSRVRPRLNINWCDISKPCWDWNYAHYRVKPSLASLEHDEGC